MSLFVNHLVITRVNKAGFVRDFGHTSGATRSEMLEDFLNNVDSTGFTPGEELKDFLLEKAEDGDVLEQISDCGNYKITLKFHRI